MTCRFPPIPFSPYGWPVPRQKVVHLQNE